jgi:indole-3-glycerol phosphate synthase
VTDSYVKTGTFLDKILAHKVEEIAALRSQFDSATVMAKSAENFYTPRDFAGALRQDTVALIAEVKKASPSKGVLIHFAGGITSNRLFVQAQFVVKEF